MTDRIALIQTLQSRFSDKDLWLGNTVHDRATSYWNSDPTRAKAIVFAHSTEDVSFVMKACHEAGQAVVVQGGLTGCVEGAVSRDADIVLSLEKMNRIESVDAVGSTATVQAGAVLEHVQQSLQQQGLRFPLDLGARGSCTIGGNVATNAGGINVIRYGMMRNLVLGLEAVLADGTVLSSMNHMLKNNAGYDLKQLFIGTEGTLGIVTRVVLRLFPQPKTDQTALVAMESFNHVSAFLSRCRERLGGDLSAFELMWGNYFHAVTEAGGHRAPISRDYPFYVVVQAEGMDPQSDEPRFESLLETALEAGEIVDAVLPKSQAETRAIWNIREEFDAILKPDPVYLYDVSLPITAMADYVAGVESKLATKWPGGALYTLGHIGDGNLHFFVAPRTTDATHSEADEIVYAELPLVGGSVSAEHGIGTEKVSWLRASRSDAEIGTMRLLKAALDPKSILNPTVMFKS